MNTAVYSCTIPPQSKDHKKPMSKSYRLKTLSSSTWVYTISLSLNGGIQSIFGDSGCTTWDAVLTILDMTILIQTDMHVRIIKMTISTTAMEINVRIDEFFTPPNRPPTKFPKDSPRPLCNSIRPCCVS